MTRADWDGPRMEDHGVIGNLKTAALVSRSGAINFCCFPEFDSPPIFAALLDPEKGGHFSIAPRGRGFAHQQLYLPETNVLLTRFLHDDGIVELTDFMPIAIDETLPHCIVRMVRCVRGESQIEVVCAPKFDFGRKQHTVSKNKNDFVFEVDDSSLPSLRLALPQTAETDAKGAVRTTLRLRSGQVCTVILGHGKSEWTREGMDDAFERTVHYWRNWISRCQYHGRWREMVYRSALTLKLMTSAEHGSIVAAPTLGLPEAPGGSRNWDYRFTWIRDASLCLREFLALGHTEEVEGFVGWLEERVMNSPLETGLRPAYRIDGSEVDEEEPVDVRGYLDSRPVRVGNAAGKQMQLDIGGPLFDALSAYAARGGTLPHELWDELRRLADWFEENWDRPDKGIWEVRGGPQHFLSSRVMCWTTLDRAVRIAEHSSLPCPRNEWLEQRDRIYAQIHHEFWSPERQAFVQRLGSTQVDASALLMPQMRFCGGTDPRWLATLEAIESELAEDALVWRYRQSNDGDDPDPLTTDEGSFTVCSFWLVECLARAGRLEQAQLYFEKMLGYANHLGLYAEQLGLRGEHLGNFPQAFTHIGLITAAMEIDRHLTERGGVY